MMVLSIWSFGHTRRLWSVLSSPNCHVLAIEAKQSYSGNFFFVKTEMTFLFLDTYISNIWNDRLKSCLLPATTRWSICATESCVWSSGNPNLSVVNYQSIRIRAKIKVGCCRIGDLRDDNFILGTQVSSRTLKPLKVLHHQKALPDICKASAPANHSGRRDVSRDAKHQSERNLWNIRWLIWPELDQRINNCDVEGFAGHDQRKLHFLCLAIGHCACHRQGFVIFNFSILKSGFKNTKATSSLLVLKCSCHFWVNHIFMMTKVFKNQL